LKEWRRNWNQVKLSVSLLVIMNSSVKELIILKPSISKKKRESIYLNFMQNPPLLIPFIAITLKKIIKQSVQFVGKC